MRCSLHLPYYTVLLDTCLKSLTASAAPLAALDADGKPRADKAVAWSLQRYLVFAVGQKSSVLAWLQRKSLSSQKARGLHLLYDTS